MSTPAPEARERPAAPASAPASTRRYTMLAAAIVALVVVAVVVLTLALNGFPRGFEWAGGGRAHATSAIKSNFPGAEWVCTDNRPSERGKEYRLLVVPGTNMETPGGPIRGAPPVDSRYHAVRDTEYMHFGAWHLAGNTMTFDWHAAWADPSTLRGMADEARAKYAKDAAGNIVDPRERDDVDNLSRGILLLDALVARDVINVKDISPTHLTGTIQSLVLKKGENGDAPPVPEAIECNRPGVPAGTPLPTNPDLDASARKPRDAAGAPAMPGPLASAEQPGKTAPATSAPVPPSSSPAAEAPGATASAPNASAAPSPIAPSPLPPNAAKGTIAQAPVPVAPSPPVEPTDAASLSDAEARAFIDQWFAASSRAQVPADVMRFYGPLVDYYKRGRVPKAHVEQDKGYYLRRWLLRRARMQGEPKIFPGSKPTVKVVVFRLDYEQEDRDRRLVQGTARVRVVLSKHDGRIAIVGESN